MRKSILLFSLLITSSSIYAQTIADFELLSLSKPKDTAYINHSTPGVDVGFSSGLAYFPCVYDTSGGYTFWSSGFSYSNYTDSISSGFTNQYSAKAGSGFALSNKYAVAYGQQNFMLLSGSAKGKNIEGFYITNNTYAYNSMRDGDGFSKKFNAVDKDFYKLDIIGYNTGVRTKDSVIFYLADFTHTDTSNNYIIKDWEWVNLKPLGKVDSIVFKLSSSDTSAWGMNTPAYFCVDNFTTNESSMSINNNYLTQNINIYPNPCNDYIYIEQEKKTSSLISIYNYNGQLLLNKAISTQNEKVSLQQLVSGIYFIKIENENKTSFQKLIKQ